MQELIVKTVVTSAGIFGTAIIGYIGVRLAQKAYGPIEVRIKS